MKKLKIFAVVATLLFLAATAIGAPSYFDGNFTNVLLKGYLQGQKGWKADNLTSNYFKNVFTSASGVFQIATGNLMVGDGSPTVTLNGEDAYIEGTLEVDGAVRFDNASLTLRGIAYTLPAATAASTYLKSDAAGTTLSWAAGTSSTLDEAYNGGIAITVDAGAVALTNAAADNNGVLTLSKSPVGAQSGDALTITVGAQGSGDALQFANSGSGYDIAGSGGLWSVSKAGAMTVASLSASAVTTTTWYQAAIAAAAAGNTNLTVDAAGNGTITVGGTSTGNTIFPGVAVFNGNVDIGNAATDTLSITSVIDSDVTLYDAATDSPSLIFKDAGAATAAFTKVNGANLDLALPAAWGLRITGGNLRVGDGSPGTAAMDGEDFYVNGASEFDGAVQFDGAVTLASTVAINGAPTITNVEAVYTTNADDQFLFTRNQGTTTKPLVAITTSAAGDSGAGLAVTSGATGAVDAVTISNAGTSAGLHITNTAAAGDGVIIDVANATTGRAVYADLGPWLGTANQGAVELVTDSATTIPAGQLLRINQQATGQHAAAIGGSAIYVKDAAVAPGTGTSYAVLIDATNIGALHVATGAMQVSSAATFGSTVTVSNTGSLTVNETVAFNFDANDEKLTITSSAADFAANAAIVNFKNATGQTNAMYILALDANADGDAQDGFLVMRDNAYTDVKFKVDSGGATTIAGLLTLTSGATVTGATDLTAAVIAGASPLVFDGSTVDGTNRTTLAVADPTAARTITLPNATGTVGLNCTATHDYGGAAVDWTLSAAESQCGYITVSNATPAVNALVPTAIPGKIYTVYNNSGQVLTFKVTGQTGGTVATGKHAVYTTLAADVVEIYELP